VCVCVCVCVCVLNACRMLCRELRYDGRAQSLLTSPLAAYKTLRNATLVSSSHALTLQPGQRYSPVLPPLTGHAIDIEMTLALPARATGSTRLSEPSVATAVSLLVLAEPNATGATNASSGFQLNASSILVNISGTAADGSRKGVLGVNFPAEGQCGACVYR
jgi:hypothetical protein